MSRPIITLVLRLYRGAQQGAGYQSLPEFHNNTVKAALRRGLIEPEPVYDGFWRYRLTDAGALFAAEILGDEGTGQ